MTEEHLIGLALMKVHRHMANSINVADILNRFVRKHPRRMALENIIQRFMSWKQLTAGTD